MNVFRRPRAGRPEKARVMTVRVLASSENRASVSFWSSGFGAGEECGAELSSAGAARECLRDVSPVHQAAGSNDWRGYRRTERSH